VSKKQFIKLGQIISSLGLPNLPGLSLQGFHGGLTLWGFNPDPEIPDIRENIFRKMCSEKVHQVNGQMIGQLKY